MSAMDLDSTESGPDGGYADMDMDDNIHSTTDSRTSLLINDQKNTEKRSRDRIIHQNYWKDFGDPFAHLVKETQAAGSSKK
jgi:hypothetical protein